MYIEQDIVCIARARYTCVFVPQHSTVIQNPLKTHERATLLHQVTHPFTEINTTSVVYSETTLTALSIS